MKIRITFFSILFSQICFSQSISNDTVYLSLIDEIKSPGFINISLMAIKPSFGGNYVNFGSGVVVEVSSFLEKFHFTGDFNYNWASVSIDDNKIGYASQDIDEKKTMQYQGILGYTVAQSIQFDEEDLILSSRGNTSYVTYVKAKQIKTMIARLGFEHHDLLTKNDFGELKFINELGIESYYGGSSYYSLFQSQNTIVLGFARSKSIRSYYSTDKYGNRYLYEENQLYGDLSFALPSKFPYVNRRQYDEFYTSDYTDNFMSIDKQNTFRAGFKKMPIGIRAGMKLRGTKGKKSRMPTTSYLELGTYTGYYHSLVDLIYFNMGISFGLFKPFN